MFCIKCGARNINSANFCIDCGNKLILSEVGKEVAKPPAITVTHTVVWVIAFIPLIWLAIDLILDIKSWGDVVVVIVLNSVMLSWDENLLKKKGVDTKPLGSSWLIPVHLFKRVEIVRSGYGYAICWVVNFSLYMLIKLFWNVFGV